MMKKILVGLTALSLLALAAGPSLAYGWPPIGQDVQVTNVNNANVTNNVTVIASTGYNVSAGGSGGAGGDGGVHGKINKGNDDNDGGNGGSGTGNGGTITTGNAYAKAKVINKVNTNVTKVKVDCNDCVDTDDVIVKNVNWNGTVDNTVDVEAYTDFNVSVGGTGGDGGEGGVSGKVNKWNDGNDGGSGGSGSGNGASINTGNAYAKAKVVNVVNTNITRIKKY